MAKPRYQPTRLTEKFVRSLPWAGIGDDGRVESYAVTDTAVPGLRVVVHSQKKVWSLKRDVYLAERGPDGRRVKAGTRQILVGVAEYKGGGGPVMALEEARRQAIAQTQEMKAGVDPRAKVEAEAKPKETTLADAWDMYVEGLKRKGRSPRTIFDMEYNLNKYLADWKDRPIREVGADRLGVHRLHVRLTDNNGPYAANRVMRGLRAVYRRMRRLDPSLPESPVEAVEFNKEHRAERAIGPDQLPAWWAAVQALPNPVRRDAHLLAMLTGLRTGSEGDTGGGVGVTTLRWEHVDLEARVLSLPTTKNGRPLLIPMSAAIEAIIRARQDDNPFDSPWVFPAPDSASGHIFSLREPKLPAWGHACRATYISLAEEAGVPKPVVQRLVGHAAGDVTEGYVSRRAQLEFLREAQERISRNLLRAMGAVESEAAASPAAA